MLTGTDFLTGVKKWFLYQNESFPKAEETAAALRTRWKQRTSYSAAIAVKCDFLTRYVPIAGITRVRKFCILKKKPRKSDQKSKNGLMPVFWLIIHLHLFIWFI